MPRPPNYNQERKERDQKKAAKKAEKLAAKAAAREEKSRQPGDARSGEEQPVDGEE